MSNSWESWFKARGDAGHAYLRYTEYMYPMFNYIYQHTPPPATLLEIGCGIGDAAKSLAILGYDVMAIDNDTAMLDMATNSHPVSISNGHPHFEYGTAVSPPRGFDVATSIGVIEHVDPGARNFMLYQMLQSAKLAVVSIPSPTLCRTVIRSLNERDITLRQLKRECRDAGWHIVRSFGWGTPTRLRRLQDVLPPIIWRRLQILGLFSLSFCVMGVKRDARNV